ncbi:MAG TPA: hypothetical protein VHU16_06250 [Candidatus Udaeobacter sp.]|jgi:hypothetical protein|nr:hypothetical protein [Candidatus Udaeobacter sp.]
MKLNTQLRSSGQVVVVLIIVLVLLGIGYWWLNSTKQEMAKGGKEFANEALQKIVVQHDINFFGSHLSPQARMNFPVSGQQEFMNEIVQMGAPVGAIDLQGKMEFTSQFFEPHGDFHARINYPARYADFDLSISHPVGRWQIDTIAFVKQSEQLAPGPAPAAPPAPAASVPPSAAPPGSSAPPADSAPPAGSAPPGAN